MSYTVTIFQIYRPTANFCNRQVQLLEDKISYDMLVAKWNFRIGSFLFIFREKAKFKIQLLSTKLLFLAFMFSLVEHKIFTAECAKFIAYNLIFSRNSVKFTIFTKLSHFLRAFLLQLSYYFANMTKSEY
jgi:hypothetical protein